MKTKLLALVVLVLLAGCGQQTTLPRTRLLVSEALAKPVDAGFARALEPRQFVFPQDHGPHPEFATEWWYYTGNLASADDRRFGYELTFFRFGLTPGQPQRASDWAANSIYMAHFALTDVAGKQFYAFERFSRGAAGLAGASGQPFRVWLENWQVDGQGADGTPMRLQARNGDLALDLTLAAGQGLVLQGDRGLSQKSAEAGNASYYYSFPRMPSRGTITVGGQSFEVQGDSWMDREWSTSALGANQVGWDWFALQLDDGRALMWYRLRLKDGGADPASSGLLIDADGSTRRLGRSDVTLEATGQWRSPATGITYPSAWRLHIPGERLELVVTPLLADQELRLTTTYWEGAVDVSGSVTGRGYVELTGYDQAEHEALRGR
ncbi:MAG TPA: lipocalin-like domain-containing protein [Roseiflexaceae bacterium]|nr:lipocalin-like domain-containing protein [Roseiflexaceae bacterium]